MGKEKENSTEQQPRLYIAQSKRSQLVGGMQKVFIVKQNFIEQHQLDLNPENKSETLPNVPSPEVESEEIEEKPFSVEEESISFDNEEETEEKSFSTEEESISFDNEEETEEKSFSTGEESVSVDNEMEIEKEVGEKSFSTEEESVSVDNEMEIEKEVEEKSFSAEEESVSVDNEMEIEKEVKEKKAFTQMTNVEKINYVLNRPHYIPNIQCAVQTKKEVYVGYIVSFEKDVLKMKSSTYFNFVTITLAEIETIQMKGLT
ncbi:hypothetical protein CN679_08495 [Bacillus pseudomycoides]|uniref:CotO family spore coat protein n=1 Tax=Bacillus pseudomycoides TaxID=64104 RepID=UPI000BF05EA6|nr:CotO family spore coat protein [Bacillus pseudomycoides]PEI93250.1 hypothetical protein CN679_08495 [Bacillus pseudomycoides]